MSETLLDKPTSQDLIEAERDYLIMRNREAEKKVLDFGRQMVEAELKQKRTSSLIVRYCQKQIRTIIPNYDEFKQERQTLHY